MKILNFAILTLSIILLVACSDNNTSNETQIDTAKAENLTTLAEEYLASNKLNEALDTYKEILALDYSDDVKEIVFNLEDEISNATKVINFFNELEDIQQNRIRDGITVTASDYEFILKDLSKLIADFEAIPTNSDNEINTFIKEIKNDDSFKGYQTLKDEANNNTFSDGGTTDLLGELDSSFDAFSSSVVALSRTYLQDSIENVLEKRLPVKYSNL